jgi:hypothetical protein
MRYPCVSSTVEPAYKVVLRTIDLTRISETFLYISLNNKERANWGGLLNCWKTGILITSILISRFYYSSINKSKLSMHKLQLSSELTEAEAISER